MNTESVASSAPIVNSRNSISVQIEPDISGVERVVNCYYPRLLPALKSCLAVFGAMSLDGRTKPLSLIFETPSGYGKTAILQMTFPVSASGMERHVYRSDKFTPKSFVSHAANVAGEKLAARDLLPRLSDKVLVTKELAPIFRGRKDEMTDNFSVLISVLDGKGFTSDSGMRGRRGYESNIIFNWIGATTPLPPETHRLMSQLGTRLLFYEVPAIEPTEDELLAYARRDDAGTAELECQQAVNDFLMSFFKRHPVGSIPPQSINMSKAHSEELVRWARLVAYGRREIKYENDGGWEPVAAMKPEGRFKVINYFKEIARGHALIHARTQVTDADLQLVSEVAVSSIPGYLRPLVRELRQSELIETSRCRELCRVSDTSARRYMEELQLLGLALVLHGDSKALRPNRIALADSFRWLRNLEHQV
jgi:hypothetical protein